MQFTLEITGCPARRPCRYRGGRCKPDIFLGEISLHIKYLFAGAAGWLDSDRGAECLLVPGVASDDLPDDLLIEVLYDLLDVLLDDLLGDLPDDLDDMCKRIKTTK